jgi:hypothetical protein
MRSLQSLARELSIFDRRSLLSLLWTAAESPTTRCFLPTIATAITATLRFGQKGRHSREASFSVLPDVLALVRTAQPEAGRLEDFEPGDPRVVVRWAVSSQRLRVDPGLVEDPARLLADLQYLSILDDDIIEVFGFGIADLQEVALRYMDGRLSQLEALCGFAGLNWPHLKHKRCSDLAPPPGPSPLGSGLPRLDEGSVERLPG